MKQKCINTTHSSRLPTLIRTFLLTDHSDIPTSKSSSAHYATLKARLSAITCAENTGSDTSALTIMQLSSDINSLMKHYTGCRNKTRYSDLSFSKNSGHTASRKLDLLHIKAQLTQLDTYLKNINTSDTTEKSLVTILARSQLLEALNQSPHLQNSYPNTPE